MNSEVLKFISSFIGGLLWYRILFYTIPVYFKRPLTRSVLKLRWHHLHWGVFLIFIATFILLISGKSTAVIILLGIGLGFITYLFIPSIQLETDREKELVVYRNSLVPTLILGAIIIILLITISFFELTIKPFQVLI